MEGFLGFLSDLILLTAGIAVLLFWLVLLIVIAVESYDFFIGDKKNAVEDTEEGYIE